MTPLLMPYNGVDVPHALVEVNQACNIRCRACYKDKYGLTKPLPQIMEEVDLARRFRRLDSLTLAGGEPTLHPELEAIITHAAKGGLHVQLLSNGYGLDEGRLTRLRAAGLSQVYLHIDSFQERPDAPKVTGARREPDLDALRDEVVGRGTRAGLRCALSVTLYQDNLPDLPSVVRYVLTRPDVHRLLVTCCTDFDALAGEVGGCAQRQGTPAANTRGGELAGQRVTNAEVELVLAPLGMRPYAFVASSRSDTERRWILYHAFTVYDRDGTVHTLHCDEAFGRIVGRLNAASKRFRGTYPFGQVMKSRAAAALCAAYAAVSRDGRGAALRLLARALKPGARLLQKSFVFQQGPNVTADGGIEWCKDCPDATIRNGRLVPVCMADLLSPLGSPAPPGAEGIAPLL